MQARTTPKPLRAKSVSHVSGITATYVCPERTHWLGRQDSNLGMSVPKTDALPLGDAPTAGACPLCARSYMTSREKAQCRHIDHARPTRRFCNRHLDRTYSLHTAISLPAGSTKWNCLPPGNEKIGLTMVPPAFSTAVNVSSSLSE